MYAQAETMPAEQPKKNKPAHVQRKTKRHKLISLNFENEDLSEIINYFAEQKKINIIAPPITTKVTLKNQEKLPLDKAFNMLNTLLDISGYVMTPRADDKFIVTKIDQNTNRETLPVYIGVSPDALPDSEERIRYLYYFDNIKIPAGGGGQAQEIKTILEDMLLEPGKASSAQILFDNTTNSVIITGKSYSIKVAMQIIAELDKTGFREVVEIIKLINTTSSFVAKFLTEQLINPVGGQQQQGAALTPPGFDTSYFSKTIKVIPDNRTNSLIILGRTQAVERLKEFIYKYIDIPLESGDSIIHVYELQYLDAQTFADDLVNIIKPRDAGQAKASIEERSFEGVIIQAEKTGVVDKLKTQVGEVGDVVQGGNRLIIAAKKTDWINLKRLIADLDKPQPQVALEVLVVDVTLDKTKFLGSQFRNKQGAITKDVNTQEANIAAPVLQNPIPVNLIADLLTLAGSPPSNIASNATPGSAIITFNDSSNNGIYWIMQVLRTYTNSKIISHPFVTTLNHQQAKVSLAEVRLITGPTKQNPDGTLTIQNVNIPADITVEILPRINLSNTINLQIAVHVNNYVAPSTSTDNSRTTRVVITNATVGNGEVLALGGLVQNTEVELLNATPLLSKIPLIGWIFKARSKEVIRESLMVFISPTIIKPKRSGGMSESTASKYDFAANDIHSGQLFDQIRDPITRWFFASPHYSVDDMVDDYQTGAFFSDKPLHKRKAQSPSMPIAETKPRRERIKRNNPQATLSSSTQSSSATPSAQDKADELKRLIAQEENPLVSAR